MLHNTVRTKAPHVVQRPLLLRRTISPRNGPCMHACKSCSAILWLMANACVSGLACVRRRRHSAWRCQHGRLFAPLMSRAGGILRRIPQIYNYQIWQEEQAVSAQNVRIGLSFELGQVETLRLDHIQPIGPFHERFDSDLVESSVPSLRIFIPSVSPRTLTCSLHRRKQAVLYALVPCSDRAEILITQDEQFPHALRTMDSACQAAGLMICHAQTHG